MIYRTELKDSRNCKLLIVWVSLLLVSGIIDGLYFNNIEERGNVIFAFLFLSVIYRLLTYCFNFILAKIVKKRFKINRLKGRITPIYKIAGDAESFTIRKYSVVYTSLELQWSIPFSVLFEEQEYILEGFHKFYKEEGYTLAEIEDISAIYEFRDSQEKLKSDKKISAKTLKQQKIDNLNKVFNENYK